MDDHSPWGASEELPPISRPPDALPTLDNYLVQSSQSSAAGGGWAEDGGGWGSAVDEYDLPTFSTNNGGIGGGGMEEITEDLDRPTFASTSPSAGGGWPSHASPEMPTFASTSAEPEEAVDEVDLEPRRTSFTTESTADQPTSGPSSPAPNSPVADAPPESDWGMHGEEPELPPMGSLSLGAKEERATSWITRDDDWAPTEIEEAVPPPMPTMGDLFGKSARRVDQEEEEGWGGSNEVPSWNVGGAPARREQEDSAELDGHSQEPASQGWNIDDAQFVPEPEPEEEPEQDQVSEKAPEEVQDAAVDESAPASSRFKLPPTLFPKFKAGIQETAKKGAETIKGAQALGGSKFGKTSMSSIEGAAQPEPQPSAEETPAPAKSSWWSRGAAKAEPARKSLDEAPAAPAQGGAAASASGSASPTQPGKLRSMLGRFARSTSDERDEDEEEFPEGWEPKNLDEVYVPKKQDAYLDNQLDSFFGGGPPAASSSSFAQVRQAALDDDGFGGLMGAFSRPPPSAPIRGKPRSTNRSLDPFDPFGEDGDAAGPPALAPMSSARIPRMISPPLQPTSRPITPLAPPPSVPVITAPPPPLAQVASFGRPLAANAPVAAPPPAAAKVDDSFDDFFTSVTGRTASPVTSPPVLSPPLGKPQAAPSLAAPIAPKPFVTPPISPPRRSPLPATATTSSPARRAPLGAVKQPTPAQVPVVAAAFAPPTKSASPTGFAPPPPPSQPLGRGFGILPPPPPGQPLRTLTPPVTAPAVGRAGSPAQAATAPKVKKVGGPLDLDDLSFFET